MKREPEPLGDVRTKSKPKADISDESKGPALFGREQEPEPLDYVRKTKRAGKLPLQYVSSTGQTLIPTLSAVSRPTKPSPSMPHQPMPRAVAYAREPEDGVWDWTRGVFMPFP